MKEQAQMQERGQDALDKKKYPGLMHSIFTIENECIAGIKLKAKVFQAISYALTGNSFSLSFLTVTRITPVTPDMRAIGNAFLVELRRDHQEENKAFYTLNYEFHIPASEIIFWFNLPETYTDLHSLSKPSPTLEHRKPYCNHAGPNDLHCTDIKDHGRDDEPIHSATRKNTFFLWDDSGALISETILCEHGRPADDCNICLDNEEEARHQ